MSIPGKKRSPEGENKKMERKKRGGMKIGQKKRTTRYTRERMGNGRTVWHGLGVFLMISSFLLVCS